MTDTPNTPDLAANEYIKETAKSLERMAKSIEKMRDLIANGDGCRTNDLARIAVTIPGYGHIETHVTIEICKIIIRFTFADKGKNVKCEITVTDKKGNDECVQYDLSASEHHLECAIDAIVGIIRK